MLVRYPLGWERRHLIRDHPAGDPDTFSDDNGSVFESDIEALAASGITRGCGPESFCPDDPVTRQQMASFLVRAFVQP
ncbi:MAG: S-layer homology domain-containing protein [Acidimicrobiia bacterium]